MPEILTERRDAIETISELLDDLYRHGSCDVRVVFTDMPREDWDELELAASRRAASGEGVKVERLAVGCSVEYVPQPLEAKAPTVIPVQKDAA